MKEQTVNQAPQQDSEFSLCAVPESERKSYLSLTIIWTGFIFAIISLMAGGSLALGMSFQEIIIASLVVTVLVFLLDLVPAGKAPFLLVVNGSDPAVEKALEPVVRQYAKGVRVKSRNLTAQGVDLILELRTGKEAQLVQACAAVPGVESVSLLAHDGEARF